MKASVIIPTYNRAHLLGRAIQSVLDQTCQDLEIIVVDDGSKDNTEEVVNKFHDERIRYIRHEVNKGEGGARNTGIKTAKGEYIAFQDSDDEWLPEKLEKQMRVFETAPPEVGVVYSDMQRVNEHGKMRYWHSPTVTYGSLINPRTFEYQVMNIGISSAMIKKECFDKVGLFDEKFPGFADLEIFIRLSKLYHFHHIKEPLVKYYVTEGISSNANVLFTVRKLLLEKYVEDIKENREFLANQYFSMGVALCSCGELRQGRSYLVKAVMAYPLNIRSLLLAFISLFGQGACNKTTKSYRKIRGLWSKEW